ncbi:MAG: histidine phosphatase family protein [Fibrobacter sp.]|jgi:broad specificity phosphatase PhoE|nr:histidine phosphatase family protein [Fibrobacter sp.]
MKSRIFKALLSASLVFVFNACEETAIGLETESVSVADSVVVRDSVNWIDSVHYVDSVRIIDSVNIIDSIRYEKVTRFLDSLRITDSLRIQDSLNIIDSVRYKDVVRYIDSLRVKDSVNIIDSVRYKDVTRFVDSIRITDSVNIVDSIRYKDVTRFLDSLRITDSLHIIDSIHVVDSVHVIDSINVIDSIHVIDRINVIDSIHVIDSLHIVDSIFIRDSLHIIDSIAIKDSLHIIDSIHVIDSISIKDSLNIIDSISIKDSLNLIDSILYKDTTRVVDSIVLHGPEEYLGVCGRANAGEIKTVTINGENRYYVCDKGTLFWRIAAGHDLNSYFVTQSAVTDFTPFDEVVNGLAEGEKVVIMVRHAERGADYSRTGPLTENGKLQSQELGAKMIGSPAIYYAGSQFIRTHQTCNNIAKGHGDADTLADTLSVLNDGWFIKNQSAYNSASWQAGGNAFNLLSKWAYEGGYTNAFYDLAERSSELIEEHLIPALEKSGKSIGVFVSHDVMLLPLIAYVSDGNIDLKYYKSTENRWVNYLAGFAVVIKPDGTKVFYAVKGLESGTM